MVKEFVGILVFAISHVVAQMGMEEAPVWPLPEKFSCAGLRPSGMLSDTISLDVATGAPTVVLEAAMRYEGLLQQVGVADGSVRVVHIQWRDSSEKLGLDTDYSYSVELEAGSQVVIIKAASPYGVAYALESLLQIQEKDCDMFELHDSASFRHRGLMIDTGRRFYPVPLVESILEGMAMYKMNVLHLHVSEECFRIESKIHPGLHTANCTVRGHSNNEYYSQEDIQHIVNFAGLRGIRVIPEFELPGHAGGFCSGLADEGIQCCVGSKGMVIQDDVNGTSVALVKDVLNEMTALFTDDVVHIGTDESSARSPCTLESATSFERKIIQHLIALNKTVMGWEEVLFTTGAAVGTPDVIIDAWARSSWQQAAQLGHPAVDSEGDHFYLDNLGSADHTAADMWLDIYHGETNATLRSFLLGGEVSMWQDLYVGKGYASCMFQSPERDNDFANSTSSMIWPRTAIAAGSFWRYDSNLTGTEARFASILAREQARLDKRLLAWNVGSCACTTALKTNCNQGNFCGHSWCGTPTPPPSPVPLPTPRPVPRPVPSPSICEWHSNTGLYGSDKRRVAVASKEDCCHECMLEATCMGADYNPGTGVCHMKNRYVPVERNDSSIACVPQRPDLLFA